MTVHHVEGSSERGDASAARRADNGAVSILSPSVRSAGSGRRRKVAIATPTVVVPPAVVIDTEMVGSKLCAIELERGRNLTRALLSAGGPDRIDLTQVEADVDELVSVWTPTLCVGSRVELVAELVRADDAIRDVSVTFTGVAATAPVVILEWVATGRFAGPLFLHDDVLVEPTGASVRSAGALTAWFRSGRAIRICCYFDRLAVLEQLLGP